MGTLFDQVSRQRSIDSYVSTVIGVAHELWPDDKTYTPAQYEAAARVAEAALKIQNADVLDEQLAGFGEILRDFVSALDLQCS